MAPKGKSKAKAKAKGKAKNQLSPEETAARNKIKENFREFDLNGDGLLQRGELKTLLKVLDPNAWNDDAVDRLIAGFDKDGDGDVSLDEFVDWITGTSNEADEEAGHFMEVLKAHEQDVHHINIKHADHELKLLKGVDIDKEVHKISESDLSRIAQIEKPPERLQRLFALVWLLLQPSACSASGKTVNYDPPGWARIQHMLQDSSFAQRVNNLDARRKELRTKWTLVAIYGVDYFFCLPDKEEETPRPPPLDYESIVEACVAAKLGKTGAAIVFYKWCLSLLEESLREAAKDTQRDEAAQAYKEEVKRDKEAAAAAEEAKQKQVQKEESLDLVAKADALLAELGP